MLRLRPHIAMLLFVYATSALSNSITQPDQEIDKVKHYVLDLIDQSSEQFSYSKKDALDSTSKALKIAFSVKDKKLQAAACYQHGFLLYRTGNTDSSRYYLQKSLDISKEIQDSVGIAKALNRMGNLLLREDNSLKAKELHEKALSYLEGQGNYTETGRVLNNLANIYRNWGYYDKALEMYTTALENYQKSGFMEGIAWLNFSVTLLYKTLGNYENALESVNKSLDIYSQIAAQDHDSTGVMLCWGQLGDIYLKLNDFKAGLEYHLAALRLRRRSGVTLAVADGLSGVGQAYYHLGRYSEAIKKINESIEIQKRASSDAMLATNYKYLGYIYHDLKDDKLAFKYLFEGLAFANRYKHFRSKKEILKKISEIYASQGNLPKAFEYQSQYIAVMDSLFNSEVANKTASMQMLYELHEKEYENERLAQDNRIQELVIERSHSVRNFLIAVVIFFVSTILWIIYLYYRKNQANLILKQKNDEIDKSRLLLKAENDERRVIEKEREKLIVDLQESLKKIKTLSGLIPICAHCKNIRNDQGYYEKLEHYIMNHSDVIFSHGICPDCARKLYPEFVEKNK